MKFSKEEIEDWLEVLEKRNHTFVIVRGRYRFSGPCKKENVVEEIEWKKK